jgi:membrane dipeptidase
LSVRPSARAATLVAAIAVAGCASLPPPGTPAFVARAAAIHARVLTLDTHVDIEPEHFQPAAPNYASGVASNQVDLPRMARGGLNAAFFSIYQEQAPDLTTEGYRRAYDIAMAKVEAVRRLTSQLAPERIGLAVTADDVRRIHGEGRLVALMGMENGYALGEDVGNVRRFAELGVRYLSLAHNGNNQLADSNTGEREGYRWNGLSPLGRQVVAEANRRGVVLDVSHPSKAANLETIRLSRAPVMASHSCARALADHSRNLDDEQLRAVGASGGVVHVTAYPAFLKTGASGRAGASVRDLVDHIDYIVKLIGIDHVGISSDFDGGGGIDGWSDASETLNVTSELLRRGYSERDVAKIWSGNLLRVLEAAERVAQDGKDE